MNGIVKTTRISISFVWRGLFRARISILFVSSENSLTTKKKTHTHTHTHTPFGRVYVCVCVCVHTHPLAGCVCFHTHPFWPGCCVFFFCVRGVSYHHPFFFPKNRTNKTKKNTQKNNIQNKTKNNTKKHTGTQENPKKSTKGKNERAVRVVVFHYTFKNFLSRFFFALFIFEGRCFFGV